MPMEKAISAADANRKFSQLLRDVREGRSYIVTSHGRPVARITPIQSKAGKVGDSRAWGRLLRRLRKQPVMNIGRWTRDELYD
jgi:prevent-host-death family protein